MYAFNNVKALVVGAFSEYYDIDIDVNIAIGEL